MARPCNVLFIMADQFRRDALRHVGGFGRTDALDALAADGTTFENAVTNAPACIPARFALATGLLPGQIGVTDNSPVRLSPEAWTWTKPLAAAGYRTSVFGKTHFHQSAHASRDLRDGLSLMRAYGFADVDEIAGPRSSAVVRSNISDAWERAGLWRAFVDDLSDRLATRPWLVRPSPLGLEHYYDTYVGRRARDYLAAYDRPEPFFCWVSFAGPHEPWDAPEPYDRLFREGDIPAAIPSDDGEPVGLVAEQLNRARARGHALDLRGDEIAALRANYAGNVALIDDLIGEIVAVLRSSGRYDDTLIVFTSDHGEMNGDHGLVYKFVFFNAAVDVPLIVKPPHAAPRGARSNALVELIDVGPTILDYAGLPWPDGSPARSLRAIADGTSSHARDYVASEFRNSTMIRTASAKCEFDGDAQPVALYDLEADPLERRNLVNDAAAADACARLHAMLADHRRRCAVRRSVT